jgi:redox-sensitive bicupin YhaK (pirin superfamily)
MVVPRARDIGGFEVRRVLPSAGRRMVGPFVFFDEMGPTDFAAGSGLDVRPHPHIGLSTITYLFSGEIMHRDSLGTALPIRPGAVNWMTAGEGIVHSERTGPEMRAAGGPLSGIQSWVALPMAHEDTPAAFDHHEKSSLPTLDDPGIRVRLIAGSLFGLRSPVKTHSDLFYADVALDRGTTIPVTAEFEERAAYTVSGTVRIAGEDFEPGRLLVFRPGADITITAGSPARFMLLGGEPLEGRRYLWWNFVASSRERIEEAKERWRTGAFPAVPGDAEVMPLPE